MNLNDIARARNARFAAYEAHREPLDSEAGCEGCGLSAAVQDGLCCDCWEDTNGQFGVGA